MGRRLPSMEQGTMFSELQPKPAGEDRPRKILYVTANLPYGPGEAFLIPEVAELLRRGHDVRIVPRSPTREVVHADAAGLQDRCTARSMFCRDVVQGGLAETFLRPRGAGRALNVLFRSRDWRTLAKNLAVYPKGLWLGGLARAWQADHIHVHWLSTPATMGMVASIVSQTPWSCTAHRTDIVLNNLLAEKLRHANFVRFISRSGWQTAASLGAPPAPGNAEVMRLGVELPAATEVPGPPGPRETILHPANLYLVKGHRYLIEAVALLRNRGLECKLLVAGDGPLRPELETQVQGLGLAHAVQFLGQRSHSEILAMYREGRVGMVVLPSVDLGHGLHEGIPVSLIEAMSYGIPVVGTHTGGIPELLEGGVGQMVPDKDPLALADAVERYVRDPAFTAETARKGRQRVSESFNVATVVSQLLQRIFPAQGALPSNCPPALERARD
jgi:glycosyltransferase involved in cell wall biosynthesis